MRSSSVGVVLLLGLTLSSCGTDAAPSADPSAAGSSSPTATSSPSGGDSSPTVTDEPTEESGETAGTYADITPATGPQITGAVSAINAPAGWDDQPLTNPRGGNTNGPNGDPMYNLLIADYKIIGAPDDLETLVADAKQFGSYDKGVQRLPDVQVAGVTGYHLAGNDRIFGTYLDEFSFIVENKRVQIRIHTPPDLAQAERDQIVGTIMASYRVQ